MTNLVTLCECDCMKSGEVRERERIVELLKPHAEHDEEMCYFDGKLICYPEDCNAGIFAWTLQLIQNERTNNPANGDNVSYS